MTLFSLFLGVIWPQIIHVLHLWHVIQLHNCFKSMNGAMPNTKYTPPKYQDGNKYQPNATQQYWLSKHDIYDPK